jgi:hypothetical protein
MAAFSILAMLEQKEVEKVRIHRRSMSANRDEQEESGCRLPDLPSTKVLVTWMGCCFILGMGLMAVEAFISRVGGSWISVERP